jgi:TolB-like protein/DNA-binding winged helix-turn-helix (wHTH) protein
MNGDLRVGTWLVQPGLNTISQNGTSRQLEPKVMEVLVCLAHHPGETLPKEQLLRTVWPDTFVSDDVLVRSISEIRRAFEDDARESKFIQTIPKRGYRLIAPVQPVNGNAGFAPVSKVPAPREPVFSKGGLRLGVVIGTTATVMVLILLALTPTNMLRKLAGKDDLPQIRSLAVLPLQNLSGDPTQEYFADAMTEELITELSRVRALKVISRTSVMGYKKTDKRLPEIARELGVDGIVEGSVLRSGDRVRITAQLIYAPRDTNVWVETYDRNLQDVLSLQSTVASAIADEIRVNMSPGEQTQLHSWRPVDLEAHEVYLQGRYHLQLEQDAVFRKDGVNLAAAEGEKAEQYFREAIQKDPSYAPSYLGIWDAQQSRPLPEQDWSQRAKPLLLKALQLDNSLAEAHLDMAFVLLFHDWDWPGAKREYQRALQLAPSDAAAHADYADFLALVEGRMQDATKEYELAQSLDPKNDHMADAFYVTRQFERAIDLYQSQAQTRPGDFTVHLGLANLYALTNRRESAISEWQKAAAIVGYREMSEAIGHAYKKRGYTEALRVFVHQLEVSSRTSYIPPWFIASIYGYMGDKDEAFIWLEKAYDTRDGVEGLRDPKYDPLRNDPRFADLLRRVGLPVQ